MHTSAPLAYAPSSYALWRRGAEYVDKLLRGTPPAHLSVDMVKEYDLFISFIRAESLGLTIAPSVLAQATEVFEPGAAVPRRAR